MKKFLMSALFVCGASMAAAQGDPFAGKTLRVIVPFGPGSAVDTQGRLYANLLAKQLNATVYVENKPGVNGALGLQVLKSAPADGLTIAMVSPSLVVTPIMSRNAGYKVEEFRPVAGIGKGPIGFFAKPDAKFNTLAELIDIAKKEKRPINIGTYAGSYQIGAAWLSMVSGASFTNIPYKGMSNAVTDVIGGNVELISADFNSMLPLVRDNKVKAVAVANEKRVAGLPNVPTVRESYKDYVNFIWSGMVVRADTPAPVVERLSQAMQAIMTSRESQDYLAKNGWEILGLNSTDMARFIQAEDARFRQVAKTANIQPE